MPTIANNAVSKLAVSLTPSDTILSVQSGTGVVFPTAANDWFPLTLIKPSGELEIVYCIARSGDVLTVRRGQEGTAPKAFVAGDRVELRLTAGAIAVGSVLTVTVPSGGNGGAGQVSGAKGASGAVYISWT